MASAAALVVVGGARAADLPIRKGTPAAEYVKVCHVDGAAGFVIPGSDTCLKISGSLLAQVEAGNLTQQYAWAGNGGTSETALAKGASTASRSSIGYTARGILNFDTATNTAYGPLQAHIGVFFDYGSGFDSYNADTAYIDKGYLTWAGLTAGKAASFFSMLGAGYGTADIFSPDRRDENEPLLLAYTATFGGGFAATISLEDPVLQGPSSTAIPAGSAPSGYYTLAGVDEFIAGNSTYQGQRSPDIVAALDLQQGWGGAHLAGVAHQVNMVETYDAAGSTLNTWGWAIDGGLKFNLPMLGDPSDNVQLQGSYSQNAVWYSGIPDGMWFENGQVNGNGVMMPVADSYYVTAGSNSGRWATPTAWALTAIGEYHLGPNFAIDPEVSYGEITWSGLGSGGQLSPDSESWIGGAVFHWDPVAHLDFDLELLYQTTHQSQPGGFVTAGGVPWQANTSGLAGRLSVTRDF
ncbi:MAG TPA: porin [Roseiarcus sp.]